MKYNCEKCHYTTDKKYNFTKHCLTKKHKEKISCPKSGKDCPILGNVSQNREKNIAKFKCEYCGESFISNHMNRHYTRCNKKKNYDVNSKIKELEQLTNNLQKRLDKKDKQLKKELENSEKRMLEMVKTIISAKNNGTTITGDNNNNTNYNMYYIINNFNEAENIEDVMASPFTQDELDYIHKNGSIMGSYKLIKDRCVTNKELSKRPVHCTDISRRKYLLRYKNEWIVDLQADQLLSITFDKMKDAYDIDCDDLDERIKSTNELIKLDIDGRKVINKQVSKDVLLKNKN